MPQIQVDSPHPPFYSQEIPSETEGSSFSESDFLSWNHLKWAFVGLTSLLLGASGWRNQGAGSLPPDLEMEGFLPTNRIPPGNPFPFTLTDGVFEIKLRAIDLNQPNQRALVPLDPHNPDLTITRIGRGYTTYKIDPIVVSDSNSTPHLGLRAFLKEEGQRDLFLFFEPDGSKVVATRRRMPPHVNLTSLNIRTDLSERLLTELNECLLDTRRVRNPTVKSILARLIEEEDAWTPSLDVMAKRAIYFLKNKRLPRLVDLFFLGQEILPWILFLGSAAALFSELVQDEDGFNGNK